MKGIFAAPLFLGDGTGRNWKSFYCPTSLLFELTLNILLRVGKFRLV